ncbi:MAG: DUF424 family protein [Candidatus Micrarchaeota archaeon]|nr:DUF424 family protein [Candidatus Micrarchaeota archaeon]
MIYLKIHKTEKGDMIAMCDENLLGKTFSEGKAELDLKTYSDFYKGDLIAKDQIIKVIGTAQLYSANIVGKESIEILVEHGIIEKGSVKTIAKVPYVHIYNVV